MGINSSKLSPNARKAIIRKAEIDTVQAAIELAPGITPLDLSVTPEQLGATVLGWSENSRILSVSIDPAHLLELADNNGITYIQVGSSMRYSPTAPKPDDQSPSD